MTGRIIILSGPSGVGKDTVLDAWAARNPRVHRVVAATTRPPRPGEVEGIDYVFLSSDEFHRRAESGAFLEYKEVHGNWYATPLDTLEKHLDRGDIAILKIDVQGALTAMAARSDIISIFLLPPSMEELERRIRARRTDSEEAIQRRLENAREEIAISERYHHRVVNDDVQRAVNEIEALVGGVA